MVKVTFILDHKLMKYRVPLFESLQTLGYSVTVIHSGCYVEGVTFRQQVVKEFKMKLLYYKVLPSLNDQDVVVQMQNLRYINTWFIALNPFRRYKLIDWTIGTSSSDGLNSKTSITDKTRDLLSRFSDAIILYTKFPKAKYSPKNRNKIFVANNTVFNPLKDDLSSSLEKDSFLFIGTLNRRKKIFILLNAFKGYLTKAKKRVISNLIIIGQGEEYKHIQAFIEEHELGNNVIITGEVQESNRKKLYFQRSIANISPNQAGLSVLESFSYGVPFVTNRNAISGGEHLNVIDGVTGYTYHKDEELLDILMKINNNIDEARELGRKAYQYYISKRDFTLMVSKFDEAIKCAMKKR